MKNVMYVLLGILSVTGVVHGEEVTLPQGYDPHAELVRAEFPISPNLSASVVKVEGREVVVDLAFSVEKGIFPNTNAYLGLVPKDAENRSFVFKQLISSGHTLGAENTPLTEHKTYIFPETFGGVYTMYAFTEDRTGAIMSLTEMGEITLPIVAGQTLSNTVVQEERGDLGEVVLVPHEEGVNLFVRVAHGEANTPRVLDIQTFGSEGACGGVTSHSLRAEQDVFKVFIPLTSLCREPVTMLTLRDQKGVVLDTARASHTLSPLPSKVAINDTAEPVMVKDAQSWLTPIILYVALFGTMVLLLILGVLIKKYKKDEKPALSPRLLLVIALMAFFFSIGSSYASAGTINYRLIPNECTSGPCPLATSVFYSIGVPASVPVGAPFDVTLIISSDDAPQPNFCPYVSYRVTNGAPYTGDIAPDCYDAQSFREGTLITHRLTAPSAPGTHSLCASVGLDNYLTPPVRCVTYVVTDLPSTSYSTPGACGESGVWQGGLNCMAGEPTLVDCKENERAYYETTPTTRSCSPMNSYAYTETRGMCVFDAMCLPPISNAPNPFSVVAGATCSSGEITVTWGNVSEATGYDIEINGVVVSNVSSPYIESVLGDNVTKSYRVRATNALGHGPWTSMQTGTTAGSCATPPLVPTGLVAAPDPTPASGIITVSFNPAPGATSYTIRDGGTVVYTGPATVFVHTTLVPGSTHSYTVSAENGAGSSGESAPVLATATPGVPLPPPPSGLTPTPGALGSGEMVVTWNPVPGASGYTLHELSTGNTITIPGTTYVHGGLTGGNTYTYIVRTEVPAGSSIWSAPEFAVMPTTGSGTCDPTTRGLCTLGAGRDRDIAGSCQPLGSGTCSYECDGATGAWEPSGANPNQCVGPRIDELHICTDTTETNCTTDGGGMGGNDTPVYVCYNSSEADQCELRNPAGLSTGGAQDSCVATTLGVLASGPVTLDCYNLDGGNPVSVVSETITTVSPTPAPTLRLSKNIVKRGESVVLSWNTGGPHENTCTLTGTGVTTNDLTIDGGSATTGDVTVTVQGRTLFEIRCGAQKGTAIVEIVPEGNES